MRRQVTACLLLMLCAMSLSAAVARAEELVAPPASSLAQYRSDGTSEIPVGGVSTEATVVLAINNVLGMSSVEATGDDPAPCDVSGWTSISQVSAGVVHTAGLRADGTVVAVGDNGSGQCNVDGWTQMKQVAAGTAHTVGLRNSGAVWAVGNNASGQCNVSGWTDIVQVAAGGSHTVGVRSGGTVVAVGANANGQCNVSGWTNIVEVAAGNGHTLGLRSDGTVVAVGYGGYGECSIGSWVNVRQISAGAWHSLGLKNDGTVLATGHNGYGQTNVGGWSSIRQVSGGWYHSLGLRNDGSVVAVGSGGAKCNVSGWSRVTQVEADCNHSVALCRQPARAEFEVASPSGTIGPVIGPIVEAGGTSSVTMSELADGRYQWCARLTDDASRTSSWTYQYGDEAFFIDHDPPTGSVLIDDGAASCAGQQVELTLSAEDWGTAVVDTCVSNDGVFDTEPWSSFGPFSPMMKDWVLTPGEGPKTVWVRYRDSSGNVSSPCLDTIMLDQPDELESLDQFKSDGATAIPPGGWTNEPNSVLSATITTRSAGSVQFEVKRASTAFDGTALLEGDYVDPGGVSRVTAGPLADGDYKWRARLSDGEYRSAWKEYSEGETALRVDRTAPVGTLRIDAGASWCTTTSVTLDFTAAEAGSGVGSVRISDDGTFDSEPWQLCTAPVAWTLKGDTGTQRVYAQLKDLAGNVSTAFSDEIEVCSLGTWPLASELIQQRTSGLAIAHGGWTNESFVVVGALDVTGEHTAAATGANAHGQANVSSWTNVKSVAAGDFHTLGLKYDGTVVAIGSNARGQCDVSTWTGIKQIAAGRAHSVGLKDNGTVVAIGSNEEGQIDVAEWSNIRQVAAGSDFTVGVRTDGTVVGTGANRYGNLDVGGWTGVRQVAAGWWHTVGLKSDGTVVATGNDSDGQTHVESWTNVRSVAAGFDHTVGLKSNGTVVAAGGNDYGQLGVTAWTGLAQVACGGWHTLGLSREGTVVATGRRFAGQLNVSSWRNVVDIEGGREHSVAIMGSGLRAQFEVKPKTIAFNGAALLTGNLFPARGWSKANAAPSVDGFAYRWRARLVDGLGRTSTWSHSGSGGMAFTVDRKRPHTHAPRSAGVVRGGYARLYYRVDDLCSPEARTWIYAKTLDGRRLVVAWSLGLKKTNVTGVVTQRVWLSRGTYRLLVYAQDLAGNWQNPTGSNYLEVR